MRILAVSDKENEALWDHYQPELLREIDMIISCGDLKREYLEFLVTMARCPLFYVKGNHDDGFLTDPPEGCTDIDGNICNYRGIRLLGLGGSMKYREGGFMFTESEMNRRIRQLSRTIRKNRGFDILVTHAPAEGYGDLEDLAHMGFSTFNSLLERCRPKLMFYGHVHREYCGSAFTGDFIHSSGTRIINAYGRRVIDDFNRE